MAPYTFTHSYRPKIEQHDDPKRVLGRRTVCNSAEYPDILGREVVVIGVWTRAPSNGNKCYVMTEWILRDVFGGLHPYDRVEVVPIEARGRLSKKAYYPRPMDLACYRHVARRWTPQLLELRKADAVPAGRRRASCPVRQVPHTCFPEVGAHSA